MDLLLKRLHADKAIDYNYGWDDLAHCTFCESCFTTECMQSNQFAKDSCL